MGRGRPSKKITTKPTFVDIGIGKSYIERYKKQYKIDKITIQD